MPGSMRRNSAISRTRDDFYLLVGANACGFKRLRAQLFIFVGDHMHAKRELVDIGTLSTKIEDSDFWIRYTTVES